ncbi:hypothetical protein GIB67_020713 [Kingdonia uniflora]|uniref:Factor of DNA methylation 1-5/IDN2 domain-containing protein n=1 Tax=Kingdonia uniflora TaxID=39325 RepID=A0A7J7P120_9MAGN|nr:hypothetical protein GIB67_020713 [Kingdonia uniflora]
MKPKREIEERCLELQKKKVEMVNKELEEKINELQDMECRNQTLTIKECMSNRDQEVRKVLLSLKWACIIILVLPLFLIGVEHILQDMEEIVDGADEKLVELKREWGEEVYRAVSVACVEAIEYTSSGRYTVPEFWNFKEGRKACVEAIEVS